MRKKIQLLRNESVYTPSEGKTALDNARTDLSNVVLNDGEIVIGRYQEENEDVKTVLGIKHNIDNTDNPQEPIEGMTFFTSCDDLIVPTKVSDLVNDSGFINSVKTINSQSMTGSGNIDTIIYGFRSETGFRFGMLFQGHWSFSLQDMELVKNTIYFDVRTMKAYTYDGKSFDEFYSYDDTELAGRVTANETALTNVYTKTQVDSKFENITTTTVSVFDGDDNYVKISADYDGDFDCNTLKFTDLWSGNEALFSLAPMGYALNLGKYKTDITTMPSVVDGVCTVELYPGYNIMSGRLWRTAATVKFTFHQPTYDDKVVPEYYLYMPAPGSATSIRPTAFNFDNLASLQGVQWKDGTTPDILANVTADGSLHHIIKFTLIKSTSIVAVLGEVIKYS